MDTDQDATRGIPRCHYDPRRGSMPTGFDRIRTWCVDVALDMDGAGKDDYAILAGRLVRRGMEEKTAATLVATVAWRAADQAARFIWDLAREFTYDPISHDAARMTTVVERQILIETIKEDHDEDHLSRAESLLDESRTSMRRQTMISAVQTLLRDCVRDGVNPPIEVISGEFEEFTTTVGRPRPDAF